MSDDTLPQALAVVASEPHSAASSILYALVSTLEYERAGCLFKLTELEVLDQATRRLACDLMELLAASGNTGDAWERTRARMC